MLKNFARFVVTLLLTVTAGIILWRKLSADRALPFPAQLSFVLDNPYLDKVAGSQTILKRSGLQAGMAVADIGCGTGRITIPAAKTVGPEGHVVALDIQSEMLEKVNEKMFEENISNIELRHAGAGEGFLEPDRFDRIYMVGVFGEIPHQLKALEEAKRALKKGGMLSITEVLPGPLYQSKIKTMRLCAEAGLEYYQYFENNVAYTLQFLKKENDRTLNHH